MRNVKLAVAVLLFAVLGIRSASAQDFDVIEATIDSVHAAMDSGELSCRELVSSYLERIDAFDQQGPELNTIQTINQDALDEADALDSALEESGRVGPLHCVPVLLKDQVETADMPTTYGSILFEGFMSGRDATIVTRMKDAGAIILAKTNMGEYAFGYLGSAFGIVRNAYDPARIPSGSSAGTGSGIAANFGLVGIGEDTGGSVRGPAAVNSLVGLRPTVPLVSRYGMMPATPSNDTLGPITRTVTDAAILLGVIAGYDPNDPVTAESVGQMPQSYRDLLEEDGLSGARIGVIREPMDPATDPESDDYKQVRAVFNQAIVDLESLGADVIDPVDIPLLELVHPTYGSDLFTTEQAMNGYLEQFENAPVSSVREILVSGTVTPKRAVSLINVVGKTPDDHDYLDVLMTREAVRRSVLKVMADHRLDAVVYATFDHQTTLIPDDALTNPDSEDGYGRGNNRRLSPLTGLPAITVPAGYTDDELPVGLEMLGRDFTESDLLRFAYAYEQATLRREPPASTPALD